MLSLIYTEKKALKRECAKLIIYGWKFEVTFLWELLSNQWNNSTRKSSTSKPDTSENCSTALFAVLWIMWQRQPFINIFFSSPIPLSWWNSLSLHSRLCCPAQKQYEVDEWRKRMNGVDVVKKCLSGTLFACPHI